MQASTEKTNSSHSPSQTSQIITKASSQKSKIKLPIRNKSAFILFSQDKRPQLKQEMQLNSNEIMVKLGELWQDLNPSIKESYKKLAADDKERYLKEKEVFSQEHPSIKIIHNRTKNSHVKKACSAYAVFFRENLKIVRQENPGLKMADLLKVISKKWNGLPINKIMGYKRRAIKEQERAKKKQEQAKIDKPRKRGRKPKTEKKKLEEMEEEEEKAVLFDGSEGLKQETVESVHTLSEGFDIIDKYFSSSQDELGQLKPDFDSFMNSPMRITDFGISSWSEDDELLFAEVLNPKVSSDKKPDIFDLHSFDFHPQFSSTTFEK